MGGDPPAPKHIGNMTLRVGGLRWHGPIPVVGAPNRSGAMPSSLRLGPGAVAP
jgi:hypothetical protein